jgi:predicted RNase H-like HicB family nuclease
MPQRTYAAIVHKEADVCVAECLEVGSVSQCKTIEEAVTLLQEATELYMEEFPPWTTASPADEGARPTLAHTLFNFSITL